MVRSVVGRFVMGRNVVWIHFMHPEIKKCPGKVQTYESAKKMAYSSAVKIKKP